MYFGIEATRIFWIMALVSGLLLWGAWMRCKIPFFRHFYLSSGLIGGTIGFFIMSSGLLPLHTIDFEELALHAMSINLMALTYLGIIDRPDQVREGGRKKGLHMALVVGGIVAVQVLVSSLVPLLFKSFNPYYAVISANGFGGSPTAALAAASIWHAFGLPRDIISIGVFYAAIGFLVASFVGVPLCRWMVKNGLIESRMNQDEAFFRGSFEQGKGPSLGQQKLHRANMDTYLFHLAFLLGSYGVFFVGYIALLNRIVKTELKANTWYTVSFVFAIFFAVLVTQIVRRTGLSRLFDEGILRSFAVSCTDILMVVCMLSVSFSIVTRYLLPLSLVVVIVSVVTGFTCYHMMKNSGRYWGERFLVVFGICTGTLVSGQNLLRLVDPDFVHLRDEIVWYNVFGVFTNITFAIATFAITISFSRYLFINLIIAGSLLSLSMVLAWIIRRSEGGMSLRVKKESVKP